MFSQALLVEDDLGVVTALRVGFDGSGMVMAHAGSLEEARNSLAASVPELALVDLILPDGNGLELVRELRQSHPDVAIVILTGLGEADHVIEGLERGADLYIKKPFTAAELRAHLKALHRRMGGQASTVEYGGVEADLIQRRATFAGRESRLTDVETRLLSSLLAATGEVVTREELLLRVWNLTFDPGTGLLHSHIRNLRRKLKPIGVDACIAAVRGRGYRFEAPR